MEERVGSTLRGVMGEMEVQVVRVLTRFCSLWSQLSSILFLIRVPHIVID